MIDIAIIALLGIGIALMIYNHAIIRRAIKARERFEAASKLSADEERGVVNELVHLKSTHIELTGALHKSISESRSMLNTLIRKADDYHAKLQNDNDNVMKELGDIKAALQEMKDKYVDSNGEEDES